MEFNRNQFFLLGLVLLFMGIQFRLIDSFVLNEKASRFVSERMNSGSDASVGSFMSTAGPTARRSVRPPQWIGWALMSAGSVFILHSLAMKKPGA